MASVNDVVVIVVAVVAVAVALLLSFLYVIRRRRRRHARLADVDHPRPDVRLVDADHQCFQLQRLPEAPPEAPTITIYLANGQTGRVVSTATVWIGEVIDAKKKYQTFDILKMLYLTQQGISAGNFCGNYVCVVNGQRRFYNEVVAPHVKAGTVVSIWPKSAWGNVALSQTLTLDPPDRPG